MAPTFHTGDSPTEGQQKEHNVADQPTTVTNFDDLEQHFQSEEAFKPVEQFMLAEIVEVKTSPMPERLMKARNLDWESAEFKAHFPQGIPCLEIVLKGLDVDFAFSEDHLNHIYIEMVNFQGDKIGQPKGERSRLDVTNQAFQEVFGVPVFGPSNRAALKGKKARWGQHIDSAKIGGETRRWSWDVPRNALPNDYVYQGDVRVIGGQTPGNGVTAPPAVETLSDDEAVQAVLAIVSGRRTDDHRGIGEEILNIKGLPQEFVNKALDGTILQSLHEQGLIDQENGLLVVVTQSA